MKECEHIIVGVALGPGGDALSEGCRHAASFAGSFAAHFGAAVTFVHSSAEDEHWNGDTGDYVAGRGGIASAGRAMLDDLVREFADRGVTAEVVVSDQPAYLAVATEAVRREADLAIVGKRTSRGAVGPLLGSVSAKLVRDCPCDVCVVKPGGELPSRRILIATNLGEVGDLAVATGAGLAREFDAELHLVHAFPMSLQVQFEGGDAEADYVRSRRAEITATLETQLREAGAPEGAGIHVGVSSPTSAILAAVERFDPDLTVMGAVARRGLPRLVIGNTAARLLARIDGSIFVVKLGAADAPGEQTG